MHRIGFRWHFNATVIVMGLSLAACQTTNPEPRVVTKTVDVAVPVQCHPNPNPLATKPAFPDTDAALASVPDVFTGTKLLKAGRKLRDARIGELEAALAACTGD